MAQKFIQEQHTTLTSYLLLSYHQLEKVELRSQGDYLHQEGLSHKLGRVLIMSLKAKSYIGTWEMEILFWSIDRYSAVVHTWQYSSRVACFDSRRNVVLLLNLFTNAPLAFQLWLSYFQGLTYEIVLFFCFMKNACSCMSILWLQLLFRCRLKGLLYKIICQIVLAIASAV